MTVALLALTLTNAAYAQSGPSYASEPQELYFEDVDEVFSVIAFDTGWLPGGSPITVRFHITPSGGVVTAMEAESLLEWPDPLAHSVVGVPGSGFLAVDSRIEIAAELGIDIFGLWSGTIDLWRDEVDLYKATAFDPLLLGEPADVTLSGAGWIDPIELSFAIFTGLDVEVDIAIYPELSAAVTGKRIDTTSADGMVSQTADGEWTQLPAPNVATAEQELSIEYVSDLSSRLDLVIEPSVSLSTFIGGFQLVAFPIPVPLVDGVEERVFPAVTAVHPMPVLGPTPGQLDAGEMLIGGLVNVPLTVENFGAMPLEGTARIRGSDDFSVFPSDIFVAPGSTDGVMVSFAPVIAGEREVILELATNDPAQPLIEIPIVGIGLVPEVTEPNDDGPPDDANARVNGEEVKGCGCDQGGVPGGAVGMLAGALALVRRRR